MISFQDVTIRFGNGTTALQSATFDIPAREFVFLIGPSGAGKSTILQAILGVLQPVEGQVLVGEEQENVAALDANGIALLRQDIGVVFQDFKLIPTKSVGENVAVGLQVKGYPKKLLSAEVSRVLISVGLEDKINVFPLQLSAGELQRVAIARAFAGGRSIILADEPTGNLDPKTSWDIMKLFLELQGKHTIIIATHNTDIVNSLDKRVIELAGGKILKK